MLFKSPSPLPLPIVLRSKRSAPGGHLRLTAEGKLLHGHLDGATGRCHVAALDVRMTFFAVGKLQNARGGKP